MSGPRHADEPFQMKMKLRAMIGTTVLALLSSCGPHESGKSEASSRSSEAPPLRVKVVHVQKVSRAAVEEVVGTVRSKQRAMVEAKVPGRLNQYLASPGQVVKAGELLAQLDGREIEAKVDSAQALLEQADRELARYRQLISQNAVTRQELEAVEARQKVAAAQVIEAETQLTYTRVTSPFDGVVTRKLAEVGDLALPGKALVEVESPRELRFEADLPEAILDRVRMGQELRVTVGAVRETAVVSEIAPIADAVSRTFRVKLDLPASQKLRTGQFGRVAVPVAEARVLAVPQAAVIKRGQIEAVYVVQEGRARLRLVKTGRTQEGSVELLSGVEEGQPVEVGS